MSAVGASSRRRAMRDMDGSSGQRMTADGTSRRRTATSPKPRHDSSRSTIDSSMRDSSMHDISTRSASGLLGGSFGDMQNSVRSPTAPKRALGKKLSDSHEGDAIFRLNDEEKAKWPHLSLFGRGSDHQQKSPKQTRKTKAFMPTESPN